MTVDGKDSSVFSREASHGLRLGETWMELEGQAPDLGGEGVFHLWRTSRVGWGGQLSGFSLVLYGSQPGGGGATVRSAGIQAGVGHSSHLQELQCLHL